MTYNVFGGTLNLTQSINLQSATGNVKVIRGHQREQQCTRYCTVSQKVPTFKLCNFVMSTFYQQ